MFTFQNLPKQRKFENKRDYIPDGKKQRTNDRSAHKRTDIQKRHDETGAQRRDDGREEIDATHGCVHARQLVFEFVLFLFFPLLVVAVA